MPSSQPLAPSYRIAARAVPYALPTTLGFVVLAWGIEGIVSVFGTRFWSPIELLPVTLLLLVATGLLLFGGVGVVAIVVRETRTT